MKNLPIFTKLTLSNLFYIIPVGVLIYFVITVQTQSIDFALLEKKGNVQQRPLQRLIELLGTHSNFSQKKLYAESYTEDVRTAVFEIEKNIDQTILNIEQLRIFEESSQEYFHINIHTFKKEWEELKFQHSQLKSDVKAKTTPDATAEVNAEKYAHLISDISSMIFHLGNISNLILDPDLDSYYVMNLTVNLLPNMQEHLIELILIGNQILHQENLFEKDRVRLMQISALLETIGLKKLIQSISIALDEDQRFNDVSPTLQAHFPKPTNEIKENVQELISLIEQAVKQPYNSEILKKLVATTELTFQSSVNFWNLASKELDQLLAYRIIAQKNQRKNNIIYSIIVFLLSAAGSTFLGISIRRGVLEQISETVNKIQNTADSALSLHHKSEEELKDILFEMNQQKIVINLYLEITMISNEANTLLEAIQESLKAICLYTSWPFGHAYIINTKNPEELIPSKCFYMKDYKVFEEFKAFTEQTCFKIGIGLPGRVLQSKKAHWINDISRDQNFPRLKTARAAGLRSAFAFPVLFKNQVVAVFEFFSNEVIQENHFLLDMIAHVGRQLEQVCEREASEKELRLFNQTLELRVAERAREIQLQNEELAQKQQLIVNASKMSSLGEMAGGIAHEINNPLTVIKIKSEQIKEVVEENNVDKSILTKMTEEIAYTAERISKIVKGLRSFARDGSHDPFQTVSLQAVLDETLEFCREKIKSHDVQLDIKSPLTPLKIECRSTQISQVLLNFINNSYDAIESLKEKWIHLELIDKNDYVEISITDSGPGIPKGLQEKIMQPFFTTKEVGRGIGLGLSIAKGIIASHNGKLSIDDESINTRFVIVLPKTQNQNLRDQSLNMKIH